MLEGTLQVGAGEEDREQTTTGLHSSVLVRGTLMNRRSHSKYQVAVLWLVRIWAAPV
jgi:hypothetical protein